MLPSKYAPFYPSDTIFAARFGFEPVYLASVSTGDLLALLAHERLNIRSVISVQAEIDARRSRYRRGFGGAFSC